MAYIGQPPNIVQYVRQLFSGTGAQTIFTLQTAPPNGKNSLLVMVTGVVQAFDTMSVSGTTLTFTEAPPSGTNNIEVLFLSTDRLMVNEVPSNINVATVSASSSISTPTITGMTTPLSKAQGGTGTTDFLTLDQTWTGSQRGALVAENDLSIDLSASNNFTCTTSTTSTLTFTNMVAGQSGWIKFVITGTPAISAHANTKISTANLTKLGVAGTYVGSYFCDGTDVYVSLGVYA
jgi:hypothetical protein